MSDKALAVIVTTARLLLRECGECGGTGEIVKGCYPNPEWPAHGPEWIDNVYECDRCGELRSAVAALDADS